MKTQNNFHAGFIKDVSQCYILNCAKYSKVEVSCCKEMRDIPIKKAIPSLVVYFQGKEKAIRLKVKLQSRSYITSE